MTTNFLPRDIIYPIKKSNAYNMTQLKKVIKAEIVEIKNDGKIAVVRLVSIKEPVHPNHDGTPINSMMANFFSMNTSIEIKEGQEIEVYLKDFYKRNNPHASEYSKYGIFFYLKVLQGKFNV